MPRTADKIQSADPWCKYELDESVLHDLVEVSTRSLRSMGRPGHKPGNSSPSRYKTRRATQLMKALKTDQYRPAFDIQTHPHLIEQMVLARGIQLEPSLASVLGAPNVLGKLAVVKLRRESSSHEPNLRRCLGHHGVFQKCLTATESPAQIAGPSNDPPKAVSKPRRASESISAPIRAHITTVFKGIVQRRQEPRSIPKNNDLSRVQARGLTQQPNTARSHHSTSKILSGLNPFARLKQRVSYQAVS